VAPKEKRRHNLGFLSPLKRSREPDPVGKHRSLPRPSRSEGTELGMGLQSLCPSFGSGTLREDRHECSNCAESKSPGDDEGKQLPASAAGRKPLRQIRRHLTHHPSSTSPPTRGALDSPHSLLFFPRPRLAPSVAREVGSSWRAYRYGVSPRR
jgi:hypothetical protein